MTTPTPIDELAIAKKVVEAKHGGLDWRPGRHHGSETAYVECPGLTAHSTANGRRDCRIAVGGGMAPTYHCLHQSCQADIEAANADLRRAIGRAKWEAAGRPALSSATGPRRRARPGSAASAGQPSATPAPPDANQLGRPPVGWQQVRQGAGTRRPVTVALPWMRVPTDDFSDAASTVVIACAAYEDEHGRWPDAARGGTELEREACRQAGLDVLAAAVDLPPEPLAVAWLGSVV